MAIAPSAGAQIKSEENFGSLFPPQYKNPLLDRTARGVGDLLTIIVSENASSNVAASTTATKKDATTATANVLKALNIPIIGKVLDNLNTTADSSVAGAGTSTNTSTLTARVAVLVKQVLPNGNMIVEGTRWVKVNKEETNITFTGIVRRDDVRADNTVLSQDVAEAKITNVSKGLIADRQRKGFLTRLLDWLF